MRNPVSLLRVFKPGNMQKKIRVIWDFRGPAASQTARHYCNHLREYPLQPGPLEIGSQDVSDIHSLAYMVIMETELAEIRDSLKPHRGEYV